MERFLKSRYKIGEKISENPFSVTYKGAFLGTHKPLVIKIYKRGTLNSGLINRMKQKVRELSLISHHGIAKLIDGDYGWQGFYYVREYIKGESLQHILESSQNIGIEKAVKIAEEVCHALEFAHNKGIIHGAIKPNNIFIDSHGLVRVADFVIEGEIKEAMPQKILSLMDDGRYASPEELAGKPASVTSDVYALGIILYELAVNRCGLVEEGLSSGLIKLRNKSLLNQEELASLPRYLQDVVSRALQSDPQLRFPSMTEFRESLEKKNLVLKRLPQEEYITLFENTVTQYGGEELDKESESLEDLGRVKISWGKEKHRNWILALILGIAFLSGILYVFLFAW
ncbi:MAG: serine/threonine-protein kinase [Candidatus Margulisiibacteriota bacterium]